MSDLGRAIGVPAQTVRDWITRRRQMPCRHCPSIEVATGGLLVVEHLRPDAPWLRMPDPNWPHPAGRPVLDIANTTLSAAAAATEGATA
jgi:hypothetical protein